MERHYNAGYYLIKTKPIDFGVNKGMVVTTCSRCINISVFDYWCSSWISDKLDDNEKKVLGLTDENIKEIQQWTDSRFDSGSNVFPDLKTALEFKDLFFKDRNDIEVYSLNFPETDANWLLEEFSEGKNLNDFNSNNGNFELKLNLNKKTEESSDIKEEFMGYDLIGVECDGSFHSFHCNSIDIQTTLIDTFSLKMNSNGLFEYPENPNKIREYINDPKSFLEPVPYYIVKVKRLKNASS